MIMDSKNVEMSASNNTDSNPPQLPPAYPQPQSPGHNLQAQGPHAQTPSPHPQASMGSEQPPVQYPPTTQAAQMSAGQIGEQYRAELFAQCAKGNHERTTKYGVCGIITAVVFFPIGLICLFMDTDEVCSRCGVQLA